MQEAVCNAGMGWPDAVFGVGVMFAFAAVLWALAYMNRF